MSRSPASFASRIAPLVLTVLFARATLGLADEVTVKGTVLRGNVVAMSPAGVTLRTEYGTGDVLIPWADVTAISTDAELYVLHGDEGETNGRVLGYQDGVLLVGQDTATAQRIDVSTIVDVDTPEEVAHWYERFRNRWRYWTATLDAGMTYQDTTTDEFDFALQARIERRKKPTRLLSTMSFIYGTDRAKGESARTTDNEIRGLVKGEYDIASSRFFGYSAHDAEYDEIDKISLRYVGKLGPGYRLVQTETFELQVESGLGYNYERFFGGQSNEFGLIPFGAEGRWKLPYGALFLFKADYLPSLKDWGNDYLIRGDASVALPLTEYLAVKASVLNTYDETPAAGTERNETRFLLSLSWRF